MRKSIHAVTRRLLAVLLFSGILMSCSGPRYLNTGEVRTEQSVKLYLQNGDAYEGIVVAQESSELSLLSQADKQTYTFAHRDIRRIERSRQEYDYSANPISPAEIEKYKTNRNTWVYAAGGAAIGGLAGLVVGYPIWVANDNPPPLFIGGLGAVVGSIYFGARGTRRDKEVALAKVRYLHSKGDLLEAKATEEARLKALKEEKERLKKQLEEKKKQQN